MYKGFKQLTLLCLIGLTACTSRPLNIWYQDTTELINEHNYQKALEQIRSQQPVNQQQLAMVESLAKQRLKQQSQTIHLFINQKEWGQARNVLRHLTQTQPKGASLSALESAINLAQKDEERLINTRLFLIKAELLDNQFKQQALANRIHHERFNWFNQSQYLEEEKKQIAEKLLQLSTQALLVKDYKNAQLAYEKAIEFDRQLGKGEIKQAINAGLSVINDKAILHRQHDLIKQLTTAVSTLNFDQLLKIHDILSNEPFHGAQVDKALMQAQKLRQEYAQSLDQNAARLYRKGNILKSVDLWLMALKLSPDNTGIKEKLLRAQKVLRKLKKLSSTSNKE